MPFKAPESYELDRPVSPSREPFDGPYRYSSDSEVSVIDEFDPLKSADRPYKDDASQPLRSVFDSDKSARQPLAWLDSQRRRGGLAAMADTESVLVCAGVAICRDACAVAECGWAVGLS